MASLLWLLYFQFTFSNGKDQRAPDIVRVGTERAGRPGANARDYERAFGLYSEGQFDDAQRAWQLVAVHGEACKLPLGEVARLLNGRWISDGHCWHRNCWHHVRAFSGASCRKLQSSHNVAHELNHAEVRLNKPVWAIQSFQEIQKQCISFKIKTTRCQLFHLQCRNGWFWGCFVPFSAGGKFARFEFSEKSSWISQ